MDCYYRLAAGIRVDFGQSARVGDSATSAELLEACVIELLVSPGL